jgi:hypothetical protein
MARLTVQTTDSRKDFAADRGPMPVSRIADA